MPSTYTTNTGIEKIATGEQSGTWGDTTNLNLDIIDRALNGSVTISLSGTAHTLTTAEGALSDGMYRVLVFGGTPSGTNTVTIAPNDAQKMYFVRNDSGESIVLTQGSGGDVTVANGKSAIVYADGAGNGAAVSSITPFISNDDWSGTDLSVENGGTGASSFTANAVLLGNGTSPFQVVAPGSSGNLLTSNGTTWQSVAFSGASIGKAIAMALVFG